MLKLVFIIESLENSGGSERSLTARVNYLSKIFNYEITIITTKNNSFNSYYPLNPSVSIVNIPISYKKSGILNLLNYFLFNINHGERNLYRFIIDNNFQICSSLGSETLNFNINKSSLPIVRIKENRFTYKKFISDQPVNFIKKIWRNVLFHKSIRFQKNVDYIITLTEEDRLFWKKYYKSIVVMPNFINFSKSVPSNLCNKVIIAVGRLEKEKDFSSLINSFSIVHDQRPDWILEIYGEGSQKDELLNIIRLKNLESSVFLKGSSKEIFLNYQYSSIYVHTAVYEGFGNTILEAMSHALPIVAFESVGGVKLLVKNDYNGFIINNRNQLELARKIISLIDNESLRYRLGNNSRILSEEYSEEKIMIQWHHFYQNILKN